MRMRVTYSNLRQLGATMPTCGAQDTRKNEVARKFPTGNKKNPNSSISMAHSPVNPILSISVYAYPSARILNKKWRARQAAKCGDIYFPFLPSCLRELFFVCFFLPSCLAHSCTRNGMSFMSSKRWLLSQEQPWMRKYACVVLCNLVLSCRVVSCRLVLFCLVLSCLVLSCLILSCLVLSFLVLSILVCMVWYWLGLTWLVLCWLVSLVLRCLVLSGLVLFCLVLSSFVQPSLVLPFFAESCLVLFVLPCLVSPSLCLRCLAVPCLVLLSYYFSSNPTSSVLFHL